MRVYNRYGRRDNKYKARIKILVHEEGLETIKGQVEAEFAEVARRRSYPAERRGRPHQRLFRAAGLCRAEPDQDRCAPTNRIIDAAYGRWLDNNINAHAQPGYASVTVSLKPVGGAPGDATDTQMEVVADLAGEVLASTSCA